MRAGLALVVASLLLAVGVSLAAVGGWSTPRLIAAPEAVGTGVAVDARGDAAVVWATLRPSVTRVRLGTAVHSVVRLANGRVIRRTVWSSGNSIAASPVSVAIGHGEVTVVWASATRSDRPQSGTLRAAYGPLVGRWAPARVISRWHDLEFPPDRYPRLAVAPDGEVLLTWDDSGPLVNGPAVAWRRPGHPFGVPQSLLPSTYLPARGQYQLGPIPAFDARGRAYVWGSCDGMVLTAPPHSHGFGQPVIVAPAPVLSFTLSLGGAGRGLAGWVQGSCQTGEGEGATAGPVFASVLRAGVFGQSLALSAAGTEAFRSNAVAAPGGGGTVSWVPYGNATFSVQVGGGGALGPVQSGAQLGGHIPAAADGGGDQVLAGAYSPAPPSVADGVVIRPAGGGPDQPAPSPNGALATATPLGRAAALVWNTNPTGSGPVLALSVWRP